MGTSAEALGKNNFGIVEYAYVSMTPEALLL